MEFMIVRNDPDKFYGVGSREASINIPILVYERSGTKWRRSIAAVTVQLRSLVSSWLRQLHDRRKFNGNYMIELDLDENGRQKFVAADGFLSATVGTKKMLKIPVSYEELTTRLEAQELWLRSKIPDPESLMEE